MNHIGDRKTYLRYGIVRTHAGYAVQDRDGRHVSTQPTFARALDEIGRHIARSATPLPSHAACTFSAGAL